MANLPVLYRIQELESRLQLLKRNREQTLVDQNLITLETQAKEINKFQVKAEMERKRLAGLLSQVELDLQTCQEHLQHEEAKLYDGSVMTSRGLEQVQQKVTEYKNKKDKLEEQMLSLLDEEEKSSLQIADLQKRQGVCTREIKLLQQQLKQRLAEIALEEEEIKPELLQVEKQIPVEWLERYHKIAKAHQGVGIAKVKSDSCGACHVGLSEGYFRQVKQGDDVLVYCESCGRILYF